jgi:hypothetical protein
MVGRNFWAVPMEGGWIVREEGLPDKTSRHGSEEEAWAAARERAAECKGEAFLQDPDGAIAQREWFGELPRDIKI